VKAVIKF